MYDLIGDIHGYADELEELLKAMNYKKDGGIYQHDTNTAIFLGDFIDKGPKQREVIDIVFPMMDNGFALSVIGNHELNAIAYHTPDKRSNDEFLRPHTQSNYDIHEKFLLAYPDLDERLSLIEKFKKLPLWLDLDGIRVIHACWDQNTIDAVKEIFNGDTISEEALHEALTHPTPLFRQLELLLKGVETDLPQGYIFTDSYGIKRESVRAKWWINDSMPLNEAVIDKGVVDHITEHVNGDDFPGYQHQEKPCFVGHY